jgi:hypothetical protein
MHSFGQCALDNKGRVIAGGQLQHGAALPAKTQTDQHQPMSVCFDLVAFENINITVKRVTAAPPAHTSSTLHNRENCAH